MQNLRCTRAMVRTCVAIPLLVIASAGHTLTAQTTEGDEAVYELSPFEVSSDGAMGYLATSSLAGSRLNTELRDLSAAITVVTPEFLRDTGATDLESLLVYTPNTEVGGLYGNFGGDPATTRRAPDRQTRIRGLSGADVTRNFFLTDIPFDTYNVTQVDINRGANSVLFGLGSPAGIINYTLKAPNMVKNARNVELRVGSYGSMRGSLDFDQTVIERVLGVRVAAVNSDQKFSQGSSFDRANRLYGVARFTPTLGKGIYTEIQGSYERGKTRSNRPSTTPPYDYISNWFGPLNKYVNNNNLHGYSVATIPQYGPYLANFQAGPGGNWFDAMGVVYSDPNASTAGVGVANLGGFRQRGGPDNANGSWLSPSNAGNPGSGHNASQHRLNQRATFVDNAHAMAVINAYEAATGNAWAGGWSWGDTHLTDRSVFDFYNDNLAGPNNRQWSDFDAQSFSLRQTFLDSVLGYEVAYDKQTMDDGEFELIQSNRLSIDINQTLRDEVTPNPNLGRAVVVGGNGASANIRERETLRATVYGNLNFSDIFDSDNWMSRILGRHTLTATV